VASDQLDRLTAATGAERARLLTAQAVALGVLDQSERDAVAISAEAVAASEGADAPLRARVLANHAQILYWWDRREEAEQVGLEALAFAERHGLAQIASAVVTTLSSLDRPRGPEAFRAAVQAAIDRAVASGAVSAELQARYVLARSYEDGAEWPIAESAFKAVLELAERIGRPWAPYAYEARHQLAWVFYVTGRWDEALALLEIAVPGAPPVPYAALDAVRLAIRQARGEAVPHRVHRSQWEIDAIVPTFGAATEIRAAARPAEVLRLYDEVVDVLARAWGPNFSARIRLAATTLGRLADLAREVPVADRPALVEAAHRLAADARTTRQRYDDSHGWGPEGQAWVERVTAEDLRLRWLLAVDPPADVEVVAAWRTAEAAFAAFGHVHELALVRAAYAEILLATGDAETARTVAQQARTAARELGARPLLALLGDTAPAVASVPAPRTDPARPVALTGRESEILALVAEGRSNGEIGKQLFISTKTVSVHVSNILAKLGAASRTEAAAIARRRGLVA
jgi:DNA-binding NarL/FixJ family response regulator